jgi:hypothetical protein
MSAFKELAFLECSRSDVTPDADFVDNDGDLMAGHWTTYFLL